jgi:glucokinase
MTPPEPLDSATVVGIDLGGTKIRAVQANRMGMVLAELIEPTDPQGGDRLVGQIVDIIAVLCEQSGAPLASIAVTAVGGAGTASAERGTLELAPNLGPTGAVSLRRELQSVLGHPVVLENDVNAAALGELRFGAAGRDDFVFIAVGTGIGMGVIVDGRLLRGSRGAAGEISFLPFGADALDPSTHARGPLEEATAGSFIVDRYIKATGAMVSALDVFDRAAAGDAAAARILGDVAQNIARAIVAVVAVLDPGEVVLGGGIGGRAELLAPIQQWVARYGQPAVKVSTSELGVRATVIGAIVLANDEANRLAPEGTSA